VIVFGHTLDILYAFMYDQTLCLVYEDFYFAIGSTFYRAIILVNRIIGRNLMNQLQEKRAEKRNSANKYFSVEISMSSSAQIYQFKIWNISSKGLCLVVRQDSHLIKDLDVGKVLKMKYYRPDTSIPAEYLQTQIAHITRCDHGPFNGHYLVGLSILND